MFTDKGITHNLLTILKKATEKSGNKLGGMTNAEKTAKQKADANASQAKKTYSNPSENAFQEQLPKLTKRLTKKLVKRLPPPLRKLGRYVPSSITNDVMDGVFLKIAKLAEQWSHIDRPEGLNEDLYSLSNDEKKQFAMTVANQNRMYAAAGSGITGATGFIGTVTDLLWLMLLSLRLIYQTSAIYGETLSGTEGAKRAFDILGNADLSMLTEKQAVLISINAAGEFADDIDLSVLEGLIKSDDASFFKEAIESITEQLNVSFHMSWFTKFLPVATGLTSAVYSVYIINEVAAVAQAEYANEDVVGFITQQKNDTNT